MMKGVVYGASKLPWLYETLVSALSLKKVHPGLPIDLFIDRVTVEYLPSKIDLKRLFTEIHIANQNYDARHAKFEAIKKSRFQKTLFLDGDTFIADDILDLFNYLDRFDIAAMPAIQGVHQKSIDSGLLDLFPDTPLIYPEFNTGVILYNQEPKFQSFLEEWIRLYELGKEKKQYAMDQASFRVSIYNSNLRIAHLTDNFNFRAVVPVVVQGPVRIIHAHGNLPEIARHANIRKHAIRVWQPKPGLVYGRMPLKVRGNTADAGYDKDYYIEKINQIFQRIA